MTLIPTTTAIWDVLFRDILDSSANFTTLRDARLNYPVDVMLTDNGVQFDFAIVGVDKKDVGIEVEEDILRVFYDNQKDPKEDISTYLRRGITRKSFNFAWKLGAKFDATKIDASMDKGILTIKIPYVKTSAKKVISIA